MLTCNKRGACKWCECMENVNRGLILCQKKIIYKILYIHVDKIEKKPYTYKVIKNITKG